MSEQLLFPKGFLWGAATSSHQIEGGLNNDWSRWERSPRRLASLKRRGLDPREFESGLAADSWNRFEEDLACLKKIKATAYRFSIDWSRVEPREGAFDQTAIDSYAHFIKRLQEEGIEPFVTLWHWPLPLWLADMGGWENPVIIDYFKKYTERVVKSLSSVRFWMTLNEPEGYAGNSYLIGIWPPQKRNLFAHHKVLNNLIKAHRVAYRIIKHALPETKISLTTPRAYFVPARDPLSRLFNKFASWWWNDRFLNRVIDTIDFIGLNYYWRIDVRGLMFSKTKGPVVSEMGWTIDPDGLYYALVELKKYNKPIYITENGLADAKDNQRSKFIESAVEQMLRAIRDGVDLRAYMHWSLIDNFEWGHGFTQKFGLFEVDRNTFERRPRPSAAVYARIIENNSL